MNYNVSFKGILPPYTNAKGYKVTPIAKDPSQDDINTAIQATKINDAHSGCNGRAYFYGQDLVVKKYKKPEEVFNYNPYREINALDSMFDLNILAHNIQRGEFAFTTPENETFLVSTKVEGANPNPITNKLNIKNLNQIVNALGVLDKPIRYNEGDSTDAKFPYYVPMHYDLSMGNYNVSEDKAGFFDFEYLQYQDLNKPYTQMNYHFMPDTLSDLSDISGIVSNLRNFEYRGLLPYLKQVDTVEAHNLFFDYLQVKSDYHYKRASMYQKENLGHYGQSPSLKQDLEALSKKEYVHFKCLSDPTREIIKAEAMKIELASLIYLQSPFAHSSTEKINPSEIREYVKNANAFFDKQISCSMGYIRDYFIDCKELMKSWNNLPAWLSYQEMETKLEDYTPSKSEISLYDEDELSHRRDRYQNDLKMRELYQRKITDEHLLTLDEHLGL